MKPGKAGQEKTPPFSEKVGKIMKKIQEVRHSMHPGVGLSLTNGKRKSDKSESQLSGPSFDEIRPGKRAVFKNDLKQVMSKELGERSTGNVVTTSDAGTLSKLSTAKRRRDDLLAGTTILEPISDQEEMWYSVRATWGMNEEKDVASPNLNFVAESDLDALPFSVFASEDLTNHHQLNRLRTRAGRSIKRRRRDLKAPVARRTDSDSPSPVPPLMTSRREFVIPDVPYDIPEAFSTEVISSAYDFIHNG